MALIHGKVPPSASVQLAARVVIKLTADAAAPKAMLSQERHTAALDALRQAVGGAELKPYFAAVAQERVAQLAPFDRYLVLEQADQGRALELAKALRAQPSVEEAYVEGGPTPPPVVQPADDPRSASQGYLDAAPGGIDARWAWGVADGAGVGFVDLEQGWTLNHEDLVAAGIGLISGVVQAYHGHGTAVLGQVVGVDNTRGVVGIAPQANARVVSQYRSATVYSTAQAIVSATGVMNPGDVLLLEAQTNFGGFSLVPVEVEAAVFDAIRHAVDAGIVVVQAAGNGGNDLDNYTDASGHAVLNRSSPHFRDSGAIMVGAASAAAPHSRLAFSNHGSRIDCFGWGEGIVTTGDGWTGTSTTVYTTGFGGTSGASPIVSGAALLMQSWRRRVHGQIFNPADLRAMLSSPTHNTASANPAADRIGVMPDLRRLLQVQMDTDRFRFHNDRFVSLVQILIGIINDAPGWIWVPGKGPVPVDPGWGLRGVSMSPGQRDLLAAMAAHELASGLSDRPSRQSLTKAAAQAMQAAVKQMEKQVRG
jgi:hypothetical protein